MFHVKEAISNIIKILDVTFTYILFLLKCTIICTKTCKNIEI